MVELASVGVDATKFDGLNSDPWSHQYLSGPSQTYSNPYGQTGPSDDMLDLSDRVSLEGYTDEEIESDWPTDDGPADADNLSINGPAVLVNLTQENPGVQFSFEGAAGQVVELNIHITNVDKTPVSRATNPDKPPDYIWGSIADCNGSDLRSQLVESREEDIHISTDPLPATELYQVIVLTNRTATLSVRLSEP